MAVIDPNRHPLLHDVVQGTLWVGTDDLPSCLKWADEHEAWLRFLKEAGALPRYLPPSKGPKERREEAFAEIAVAYFFVTRCGSRPPGGAPRRRARAAPSVGSGRD